MGNDDQARPESGAPHTSQDENSHLSRRGMLRNAAGLSALGIASGLALNSFTGTAQAAPASAADERQNAERNLPQHPGPVVAHLADASTGAVDLFVGERHLRLHDSALAAALARAAATAG